MSRSRCGRRTTIHSSLRNPASPASGCLPWVRGGSWDYDHGKNGMPTAYVFNCELNGAQNKFIAALFGRRNEAGDVRESQKEVAARWADQGTVRTGSKRCCGGRARGDLGAVARPPGAPEAIHTALYGRTFKEWVKRLGYRASAKTEEAMRESEQSPVAPIRRPVRCSSPPSAPVARSPGDPGQGRSIHRFSRCR